MMTEDNTVQDSLAKIKESFVLISEDPEHPLEMKSDKTFAINKDLAVTTIKVSKASWVAIFNDRAEPVAMDQSGSNTVDFTLTSGEYRACSDGRIETIKTDGKPQVLPDPFVSGALFVETDAPDVHLIDGIGEIPADGKSHCTITVTKLDADGNLTKDSDVVHIRTTGGTLKATASDRSKVIRQIKLSAGKGKFVLISDEQPRVVTVTLLCEGLPSQNISVEFTPS